MKRKFIAALALLIAAMGSAFAKKQKQASSDSELVDWQGKEVGIKSTELPSWLRAVALGNKEDVKKDLKVEDKKMIFVLTRSGDDLDFLKAWVDQIDARSEVAAALETTVAQTVQLVASQPP